MKAAALALPHCLRIGQRPIIASPVRILLAHYCAVQKCLYFSDGQLVQKQGIMGQNRYFAFTPIIEV